jgi:hypothetical protein
MIINKRNLEVVNVTKPDKDIPVLDCVNILEDGTSIGGNGRSFIVVSPVPDKVRNIVEKVYPVSKCGRVNLSSSTVGEILKNIPSDKQKGGLLEHADIENVDDAKVKINLYDGARRRHINAKVNPLSYPRYDLLYRRALTNKQSIKLTLNAKRLLPFLETIVKCSGDSGDFCPMYIEFTTDGEMIAKMVNPKTGQEVIGLMLPYKGVEEIWPEVSDFERRLINGNNQNNSSVVGGHDSESSKSHGIDSVNTGSNRSNASVVRDKTAVHDRGNIQRRVGAKKTGDKHLARIIDEICPWCGKFHLASDGTSKWCSCKKGCNYYERIN